MSFFLPREIVSELDKNIVGQDAAKRAVAIALRNRWRRQQLDDSLKEEIIPKNILLIGPTGCGKTEIARRLAKLANSPFIKVEATKFTEVGYVGRDVEQIIRDLVEVAIKMERQSARKKMEQISRENAESRVIEALVGKDASASTIDAFVKKLRSGELDDADIEIEVEDTSSTSMPSFDIPGMPGAQMGMINLSDILGKEFGRKKIKRTYKVKDSYEILIGQEADKLIDEEKLVQDALKNVSQNGLVFIDEIDKICGADSKKGADISRDGVQRDLLPLIEGTSVNTKHGVVQTNHILFITSGAFHTSKPSDLLPELQGRLPVRVTLSALTQSDFEHILKDTEHSLVKQYAALIGVEGVTLTFKDEAIKEMARYSVEINDAVENIGARRLHTVMEHVLDDISFNAADKAGETIIIDKKFIHDKLQNFVEDKDLSRFIL